MESKFEIGDKFAFKNSRDTPIMEIERIYYKFGVEPSYEIKHINGYLGREIMAESTLIALYEKIDENG